MTAKVVVFSLLLGVTYFVRKCKLNITGCRTLFLDSLYRPSKRIDSEYLTELNKSLTRIMANITAHVLLGGDFKCGYIEWSTMQVPEGVPQIMACTVSTFGAHKRPPSIPSSKDTHS